MTNRHTEKMLRHAANAREGAASFMAGAALAKACHIPDADPAPRPEHECDLCGHLTANVRMDIYTGEVDPDICDACLVEHYPHVNW